MAQIEQLLIKNVTPSATNPRKTFNEDSLKELAASIKANGVIQPIIVREIGKGKHEIIAGERRFRASKMAKLITIPAIIRNASDSDVLRWQLIENAQREDVNVTEEAQAIYRLRNELDLNVNEISLQLGKSTFYIYRMLGLCRLPDIARRLIAENRIGRTVALHLGGIDDKELQTQAVIDLASTKPKQNLITLNQAKAYLSQKVGAQLTKKKSEIIGKHGNDFAANWKYYLVRFSPSQFIKWTQIVKQRTETDVLAESVEAVMLENQSGNGFRE